MRLLVLHGPNLNLLGTREPDVYGKQTLVSINERLLTVAGGLGIKLDAFQSNHEGALIDRIHQAAEQFDGIIINPAGLTHTSVALRDALLGIKLPYIEVHISNVFRRESFRHHSFFSDTAEAVISGLGAYGYEAALNWFAGSRKST